MMWFLKQKFEVGDEVMIDPRTEYFRLAMGVSGEGKRAKFYKRLLGVRGTINNVQEYPEYTCYDVAFNKSPYDCSGVTSEYKFHFSMNEKIIGHISENLLKAVEKEILEIRASSKILDSDF